MSKSFVSILLGLCTLNNTILLSTDFHGNALSTSSSSFTKMKTVNRDSLLSIQLISHLIGYSLSKLGTKYIYIKIKGFNHSKRSICKGLHLSKLQVLRVYSVINIIFNGCRLAKR